MSRLETLDVGDSEALNAGGLDDANEAAEQRAKERLLNAVDGGGGGAAGKPRKQRPKFTDANLVDPALGLPWLMSEMPRACAGLGKRGDEAASARHLVHLYKRWCFAMFPALAFEDVLLRVQKLSSKERVRVKVDEFKRRQAYADYERRFPGAAAKRKAEAAEAAAPGGAGGGLTEEQRQMIAKKKAEALAKRQRVEAPAAADDEFPDEFPDDDEWMGENAADEEALYEAEREMMGEGRAAAPLVTPGPSKPTTSAIVADDDEIDDDALLAAMGDAPPQPQPTPRDAPAADERDDDEAEDAFASRTPAPAPAPAADVEEDDDGEQEFDFDNLDD